MEYPYMYCTLSVLRMFQFLILLTKFLMEILSLIEANSMPYIISIK